MNLTELTKAVAAEAEVSSGSAGEAIRELIRVIKGALGKDETINLYEFGNFHTTVRTARKGRHPRTGKAINIPAR